jgi:hypothetical protein
MTRQRPPAGVAFRSHSASKPTGKAVSKATSAAFDDCDHAADDRRIGHRVHTVGEAVSGERQLLKPLPVEWFETGLWLTPRVDRSAQITVRSNQYSVPSRSMGHQVRVLLNASDLTIYDGRTPVASTSVCSPRAPAVVIWTTTSKHSSANPGALPGATALAQARAARTFATVHGAWWAAACKAHGDVDGARDLVEVLLLHRHNPHEHVTAA